MSITGSGTWKWLYSLKDLALLHMRRQLGPGEDISLFYDQWIPGNGGSLAVQYPDILIPTQMQSWKVYDIIQNGTWVLKDQLLQPLWSLISQQSIPTNSPSDNWLWSVSNSGPFCFKSAWNLVRTSGPQFQFAGLVWFQCQSPKMGACLLRAMHAKLLTRDVLKSLGITNTDMCVCVMHHKKVPTLEL